MIIWKGNKQAIIRFSTRNLRALKDYISAWAALDGASGHPLPSLPLFARHDKGAGKKVKPITTSTSRNIVTERVHQALGEQDTGQITPHSFRHYFVTIVLRASGNLNWRRNRRGIPTSRPCSSTPISAMTNSTGDITTFSRRTCNLTTAVFGYTVA